MAVQTTADWQQELIGRPSAPTIRLPKHVYADTSDVVSVAKVPPNGDYNCVIWTGQGTTQQVISEKQVDGQSFCDALFSCCRKRTTSLDNVLKVVMPGTDFRLVSAEAHQDFLELEAAHMQAFAKFGVLLMKPGQTDERDMFSNVEGSKEYEEFLGILGHRIELSGWPRYAGGLSTSGRTGQYSVFREFENVQIMFHTSTLLPYSKSDSQQIDRKRHIGNDNVVIIYQDGECSATPFATDTVASQQIQVYIVVTPEQENTSVAPVAATEVTPAVTPSQDTSPTVFDGDTKDTPRTPLLKPSNEPDHADAPAVIASDLHVPLNSEPPSPSIEHTDADAAAAAAVPEEPAEKPILAKRFRVAVVRRQSVPDFGPPLPDPPVFSEHALERFIIEKLLSAQRAVLQSPEFAQKRQQAFAARLQQIVKKYAQ